jgi:aryl-alcohol dehydrogenase-like predicted oxidoreductase
MKYRTFGKTDLQVSELGFGAWAIGGGVKLGSLPIGYGKTDDAVSMKALQTAFDRGVNFYDTADFYGLGHSELLIGKVFARNKNVLIATKVGQKPGKDQPVEINYSKKYMLAACDASLQRLKRETIDYYQLHVANLTHLQQGECIEAMQLLQMQGKIRYWGISLSTFNPFPEAAFMMENQLGDGFQLVLNIINQKALPLLTQMREKGYGIIARMPLQFGLLSGKFRPDSQFDETDHRSFRLTPAIINAATQSLEKITPLANQYQISKTILALSFVLSFQEISTVIPGIKTPDQALTNTAPFIEFSQKEKDMITELYISDFEPLLNLLQQQG